MHPCVVSGRRAEVVSSRVGAQTTLQRHDTTCCGLVYDTADHLDKTWDGTAEWVASPGRVQEVVGSPKVTGNGRICKYISRLSKSSVKVCERLLFRFIWIKLHNIVINLALSLALSSSLTPVLNLCRPVMFGCTEGLHASLYSAIMRGSVLFGTSL